MLIVLGLLLLQTFPRTPVMNNNVVKHNLVVFSDEMLGVKLLRSLATNNENNLKIAQNQIPVAFPCLFKRMQTYIVQSCPTRNVPERFRFSVCYFSHLFCPVWHFWFEFQQTQRGLNLKQEKKIYIFSESSVTG